MKLRTRIVMTMILLMVASLLVIGIVTIIFFKEQNDKYHRERLMRKERAIKSDMAYFSREVELQEDMDVVIKEFEEEVLRLSTIHNLDVNIYNTQGEILVSACPDSLHARYLARKVPPAAMEQLSLSDRVILLETRGEYSYLSDYTMLHNARGEQIAILHLPYERDSNVSDNNVQEFLGSIGITYVFLFIGAIILTLLLSNSITRNLALLGERMHTVDFSHKNEPLRWGRNDEIGRLVSAYNTMLEKLEESRQMLAKTEREGAWREMARQVAHEIKNPLTPIKLSIQHLQATADFNSAQWQEKFGKTMGMIIQQIESLNNIATEFSDFAKMPRTKAEVVSVARVIQDIALLFAEAPINLQLHIPDPSANVLMDADSLGRVLSNLIKNAKHAVAGRAHPAVNVIQATVEDRVRITVEDNGEGIPEELKGRIFQPNFTTKSSGTGLGLAICMQIVEQAGGRIWFESEQGKYTRFFIELPLYRQ